MEYFSIAQLACMPLEATDAARMEKTAVFFDVRCA